MELDCICVYIFYDLLLVIGWIVCNGCFSLFCFAMFKLSLRLGYCGI